MREKILEFPKQFEYEPVVENGKLGRFEHYIVVGMGGSALAADLIKVWKPEFPVAVHRNYGLAEIPEKILKNSLIILSSYSGNTEEVLDAYEEAGKRGLARAAISIGGKLLECTKEDGVPYVQMPDTGIEPRMALGFSFKGLLKIMAQDSALEELSELLGILDATKQEAVGKKLAGKLKGRVPIIYASYRNRAIAYVWKIKFNETAKIPAFANAFPELNHNEMIGWDAIDATRELSEKFYFIFLRDNVDHPRIIKRMELTEKLLRDRGFPVESVELSRQKLAHYGGQAGKNIFHKIFSNLVLADWASYYLALAHGIEPMGVPMVEEFKKLMKD